jgi:hypothetical protein
MVDDPITGEKFLRVVGRRVAPAIGAPPSPEARRALASLAAHRTCAPKGILIYDGHADMDEDRVRGTVERIVKRSDHG